MTSDDLRAWPGETVLAINSGASSLKFGLFRLDEPQVRIWSGAFERIGQPQASLRIVDGLGATVAERAAGALGHEEALQTLLQTRELRAPMSRLAAAGHRVVHGGPEGDRPRLVTPELEVRLGDLSRFAPLHQPHNLAAIAALRRASPDLPQVACFDTAFHHGLPRFAAMTGLPRDMQEEGVRRYGFHGLSYEYALDALRTAGVDLDRERIVIAHLGDGASMCAVKRGRSVETTMGFSTLAGLPMATRCGDLDPGLLLYLLAERGMTIERLRRLLYEESGWLGLSGIGRDMRELLARPDDPAAQEAIGFFCYQARRHLAALTAPLGGLNRLVFTGGIGANAPEVRSRICAGLDHLGIGLDAARNREGGPILSPDGARVIVQALPSDEALTIVRHVRRVVQESRPRS